MTLIVDASVAIKWVLSEDGSNRALSFRSQGDLYAPSLIATEVGSALWKAVRRNLVSPHDAAVAFRAVLVPFEQLVPDEELAARALQIAIELDHPIYDCLYLALAERERAPLVSADQRLLKAGTRLKMLEMRAL